MISCLTIKGKERIDFNKQTCSKFLIKRRIFTKEFIFIFEENYILRSEISFLLILYNKGNLVNNFLNSILFSIYVLIFTLYRPMFTM